MGVNFKLYISKYIREAPVCFLAFLWCLFLFIGVYLGLETDLNFFLLLPGVPNKPSLIVLLFLIRLLPLIVTLVAFRLQWTPLVFIIALLRSFSCGYLTSLIWFNYKSAGWLICCCFFICAAIQNVILLQIWLSILSTKISQRILSLFLLIWIIIALFDHFTISPFIFHIITYF